MASQIPPMEVAAPSQEAEAANEKESSALNIPDSKADISESKEEELNHIDDDSTIDDMLRQLGGDILPKVKNYENCLNMKHRGYKEAAHCMIYSKKPTIVIKGLRNPASIMMQLRFDGSIGFPGGLIDEGEDVPTGLARELSEEMNFNFTAEDMNKAACIVTNIWPRRKMIFHFYAYEVSYEQFLEMERKCLDARDYAVEVMGIIRPPLYDMPKKRGGFSRFLCNQFIGNSRSQLIEALIKLKIFNEQQLEVFLNRSIKTWKT